MARASLARLAARARHIRDLYGKLETARTRRPWSRAELAQGFVGDVGDLMKLLMARDGRRIAKAPDLDAALAHELADCLWSVLVLADACDIDLEKAFLRTMDELEARLSPAKPRRRRRASSGPAARASRS